MANEYLINKETLDNIASQSMSLVGKTEAVTPSEIVTDLTDANSEVTTQAELLEQALAALENKTSGALDTSDATATSNDMAEGKTAYVNGVKVEGTVPVIDALIEEATTVFEEGQGNGIGFYYETSEKLILEAGSGVYSVLTYEKLGSELGDATATDVASGKTFTSAEGLKITGTKEEPVEVEQATPSITVSNSGLITASASQEAGLVGAGTKSATKQLDAQGAKTVTPGTSDKIAVVSGVYTTGAVKVKGDANLVAENIKSGVSIFNVAGTYEGEAAEQATPEIDVSSSGLITATAGDKSATLQMTTVAGKTVIPSASYQTAVAKNVYTTGTIRVKGDTNLKAENIAKGVSIFNVLGTFEGSGLPDGFTAFASDTVTFANASYGPTIEHGLGVVPNFFYVVVEGSPTTADFSNYLIAHLAVKQTLGGNSGYYVTLSVSSAGVTLASTQVIKADDISNYFNETTIMPYGFFKQGKTYRWAAGVMDGIN